MLRIKVIIKQDFKDVLDHASSYFGVYHAIVSLLRCLLFCTFRSRLVMADAEFQEDSRASILGLNSTDSTELWLIQWPRDQVPDFDGQRISLDLHHDDGQLGTFEASSGKSYDVVSFAAQEPKATVFLSSAADSKILGKITRRVSFAHYLEPSEVPKDDTKRLKQLYERSSATSLTNSTYNFATPSKSTRPGSIGRASTHSSGRKSSLSEEKVRHKPSSSGQSSDQSEEKKKKHVA
ncbi:putative mediator-associated protein 2, plant [Helianthus annuus]|nr:putative mediator-associated protein 2, plant [Helianthus annuus]